MMRIVFMGTPEFAVPSLQALLDHGYDVVGAFTQPDRPAGRGNKISVCPVKALAVSRGVPVAQVERIRRPDGLAALHAFRPDLCVTAAFGQILSRENLAVPPLGTVNVHASLLPKYRGAAPVNWAIMLGETVTGVTTMFTDPGIDTGDILLKAEMPIGPDETAGELTARLAELGASLLIETIKRIERGDCPRAEQDGALASHQPILTKELGAMDFTRSAAELVNQVRGLNPWPGATARLPDGALKVWSAQAVDWTGEGVPGEIVVSSAKQGLLVRCGVGALRLIDIQAPNAKKIAASAYLMGKALPVGTVLHG